MHSFAYLLFNIFVFVPVLILSLITDVKPHKNWRGLAAGFALISMPFIVWDIWAASAGHWGFNSYYILPWRFLGLPFEEILFFFTVPFAMMYVWGVINKHVAEKNVGRLWANIILALVALVATILLIKYWSNGYTRSAMLAAIFSCGVIISSKIALTLRFWVFQLVLVGIFTLANAILTALPIITYGQGSIIGIRVSTIPIEDFFFNFAFINLFLLTSGAFIPSHGVTANLRVYDKIDNQVK